MASSPSSAAASVPEPPIRVGDYPFYKTQPTAQMRRVVRHNSDLISEGVPGISDDVLAIFPVGSGGIEGMPGPAQVDILVILRGDGGEDSLVVTEEQIAALKDRANLDYKGPSPHFPEGDVWFRNEVFDDPTDKHKSSGGVSAHWEDGVSRRFEPGDIGSCNVHMVRLCPGEEEGAAKEKQDRTRDFVLDMIAYVDYLNQNEDAFKQYADVKLEGADIVIAAEANNSDEDGFQLLLKYKRHKGVVVNKLIEEVKVWRRGTEWQKPVLEKEAMMALFPEAM